MSVIDELTAAAMTCPGGPLGCMTWRLDQAVFRGGRYPCLEGVPRDAQPMYRISGWVEMDWGRPAATTPEHLNDVMNEAVMEAQRRLRMPPCLSALKALRDSRDAQ